MSELYWLPEIEDWRARLRALAAGDAAPATAWAEAVALANTRLDFVRTNALDQIVARRFGPPGAETEPPPGLAAKPVRLALLGSGTMAHLHAAIRVAGLRRGLWITIYENDYGQYWQELTDSSSALHEFQPTTVLLALDAHHFLRDMLFDQVSVRPEAYWHRPILVTDPGTKLGDVIGLMKVKPEHPEDDVVDNDLILIWGAQRRIITGADLLGRLLRGIAGKEIIPPPKGEGGARNAPGGGTNKQ